MSIYYVTAAVSNVNVTHIGTPDNPSDAYGIQAALDNSLSGDVVAVKADGQYNITTTIDIDTECGLPALGGFKIVEGYGNELGDGEQAVLDGGAGNFHLLKVNNVCNLILRNIHGKNVNSVSETGKYIFYVTRTTGAVENILFENCRAEGGLNGWYCVPGETFANNIQLINCEAHNCSNKGFEIRATNHGALINCKAYDNGFEGIAINNGLVYGCLVYGNGRYGIMLFGANGATILHNTVYGNGSGLGIDISGRSCFAFNNIFWGNTGNDIDDCESGTIYGDHNCHGEQKTYGYDSGGHDMMDDPRFVDGANGDFRLRLDSPCVNGGMVNHEGYSNMGAWQRRQIVNSSLIGGTLIR